MSAHLLRRPAPVRLPGLIVLAVAIALVAAACTASAGPTASGTPAGSTGSPVASPATTSGVGGEVTAGPVCPVERPGDSACSPHPVAGAVLVVQDPTGAEVARVTTDASGLYRVGLAPGAYTLVPQPVAGLMGTPGPQLFTVAAGKVTKVDVGYDTGIR
jgi:hypothetical protein